MAKYMPLWSAAATKLSLDAQPLTPVIHINRALPTAPELDACDAEELTASYTATQISRNRAVRVKKMRVWSGEKGVDLTPAGQWPAPWIMSPPLDYSWLRNSTSLAVATAYAQRVGCPVGLSANMEVFSYMYRMNLNSQAANFAWDPDMDAAGAKWAEILADVFGLKVTSFTTFRTIASSHSGFSSRTWVATYARPLEEVGYTCIHLVMINACINYNGSGNQTRSVCLTLKFPMTNQTRGIRSWAWSHVQQEIALYYTAPRMGYGVAYTAIDSPAIAGLLVESHPHWVQPVVYGNTYNVGNQDALNKGYFGNEYTGTVVDESPGTILGQTYAYNVSTHHLDLVNSGGLRAAGVLTMTAVVLGVPPALQSFHYVGDAAPLVGLTVNVTGVRGVGTKWLASAFVTLGLVTDPAEAAKLTGRTVCSFLSAQRFIVPADVYETSTLGISAALAEYDALVEIIVPAEGDQPDVTLAQVVNRMKGATIGSMHYVMGEAPLAASAISTIRVSGAAADVIEAKDAGGVVIVPAPSVDELLTVVLGRLAVVTYIAPATASLFADYLGVDVLIFNNEPLPEIPEITNQPLGLIYKEGSPFYDKAATPEKHTSILLANAVKPDAFSYLVASVVVDAARAMRRYV